MRRAWTRSEPDHATNIESNLPWTGTGRRLASRAPAFRQASVSSCGRSSASSVAKRVFSPTTATGYLTPRCRRWPTTSGAGRTSPASSRCARIAASTALPGIFDCIHAGEDLVGEPFCRLIRWRQLKGCPDDGSGAPSIPSPICVHSRPIWRKAMLPRRCGGLAGGAPRCGASHAVRQPSGLPGHG